jgi:3-hydroxyacyl-CoA dehydrogenase
MTELVTVAKQDHVGVITLNNPPVNALSYPLRRALSDAFALVLVDDEVQALVLRCEGRTFVAGADISEFDQEPRKPDVPEVVELVGGSPKPVTAALHGTVLGGGLELALACQFRVAAPGTKLGFPEVSLGILPGAGGTQRLPRLVGAKAALDMIVGGVPVSAARALALGLVDEVVEGDLDAGTLAFVERALAEGRSGSKLGERVAQPEPSGFFAEYEQSIAAESRGRIAPLYCVRAVRAALELPFAEGIELERRLFRELVRSPQSKAQRHAFFGEREVARTPRVPKDARARDVRAVAVVGANETGAAIVERLAGKRLPVVFLAGTTEDLELGVAAIRERYALEVAKGALSQTESERRIDGVRWAQGYDELATVDLVVSALPSERSEGVLARLDVLNPEAVFALVSADVERVASHAKHPEQVFGMRFSGERLLEVLCASETGTVACATAMKFGKALGKVVVCESARHLSAGERLVRAYSGQARALVHEGALPEQVDRALRDFGFPHGPLAVAASEGLDATLPAQPSNGAGAERRAFEDTEIVERCVFALIDEGARLLEDGVLTRALEVDMICIHGHGFPVYHGGPMFFADQLGLSLLEQRVRRSVEHVSGEPFTVAPLVARLIEKGEGFYS